ncbi:MAG: MoxR family ATPase [Clostridiales bacterium]|nr:MoxR family ATPase [Clostridiales bacterium]MBQ2156803.1 MoxR family ATPase [Clostridiales bacterium]MBQ5520200.1 MoxR family ATPase [Clostridiales bacterium]
MGTISENIIYEIKKVICGKDYIIAQALTAILAGGHILMEDVPGVGKTTMAVAFSKTMGLNYGRVQFTPDVLPSDITGFSLYDKNTNTMKYQPGSIFHNLFLADELNRASTRTQSALLEAMEEGNVTVDGNTYMLPKPFTVIATQNPTGASGTSLLPDSQIDRFMIRLSIGYPSAKDEKAMIESRKNGLNPMDNVKTVCDVNTILQMQAEVNNVFMHDNVTDYIVTLINKTRGHKNLIRGGSPRATLALTSMAKACAYLNGRNYVVPSDVQKVFLPVITHRLMLTPEAEINGVKTNDIAQEILKDTLSPKI